MNGNGQAQAPPKICPFLNKGCIQENCALWTSITVTRVGPLGMPLASVQGICTFAALPPILSSQRQPMEVPIKLPHLRGG